MNVKVLALLGSLAAAGGAFSQASAPAPDYTQSFNAGAVTDYRYRGISQTRKAPPCRPAPTSRTAACTSAPGHRPSSGSRMPTATPGRRSTCTAATRARWPLSATTWACCATCTRAPITGAQTLETVTVTVTVTATAGRLWAKGALDFAGGTVVHINAGISGLVGAYVVGKRIGYGKELLTPHSLTLTMVGASLLWVGWFGFNAGSNLEANGVAALAFINTLVATGAATLSWIAGEALSKGKASMLGAASGAVAGLVAITPAAGFVGPMGAIVMGLLSGLVCLWGVNGLKRVLGADDSLDVFGVHGVGGILGALLTGVFASPSLGGTGIFDYVANKANPEYSIGGQVWIQFQGVITTMIWSAVVALVAYKIVDRVIGLRVTEEEEREGLDISSHGETAYQR